MRDRKLPRWRSHLSLLTLAVAGLVVASPAVQVAASSHTPYEANIVRNPGFEAGKGTGGYKLVPIPHWERSFGGGTVVRYGAPNFPTRSEAQRVDGGHKFFSCGENTTEGAAFQYITLVGRNADIDAGKLKVTLRVRIATFGTQPDSGWVDLSLEQSIAPGSVPLVTRNIETPHVTATNGTFQLEKVGTSVPKRTRIIQVVLHGQTGEGSYCDAYFDNVDVRLSLK